MIEASTRAFIFSQMPLGRPDFAASISARIWFDDIAELSGAANTFFQSHGLSIGGHIIEQLCCIPSIGGVGAEIAKVSIDFGCHGVIVAGAKMGIGDDASLFSSRHHAYLGVGFKINETIGDLNARGLQTPGPPNVGGFVKPGLQFNHGCDAFACFAASHSAEMISLSLLVRYSVCLMAKTAGSLAACCKNWTTTSKLSKG